MKKKTKRFLSFLLTVLMVLSGTTFAAFAGEVSENGGNKETLLLVSASADTIIFKAEEGYEYAVQMEKDGEKTWQWAEEEQYNKDDGTVSFWGLTEQTEYTFARRLKRDDGADGAVDEKDIKTFTTVALTPETTPPQTTESETKAPETTPSQTTESETKAPETTPPQTTESETKAPQTTPPQTTESETKAPDSESSKESETPKKPAKPLQQKPGAPAANNSLQGFADSVYNDDSKDDGKNGENLKDDGKDGDNGKESVKKPEKPEAPIAVSVSDTKIVIEVNENTSDKYTYEYSLNAKDFQDSSEFNGLTPDTEYTIVVRVKEGTYDGEKYAASDISEPLQVHTLKSAQAAPKIPDVSGKTDVSVSFDSKDASMEYGIVGSDGAVQWQKENVFKDLKADTEYSFVFRIAYDEKIQMPSVTSEAAKVKTLKAAAAAPKTPVLEKRTETSITVKTAKHQEYALLSDGKAGTWQTGGEFLGLTPGTEYAIVTREVYDPEIAMESQISEPVKIKTLVAFSKSTISGVTNGATYDAGSSFTVTASGSGMDNNAPVVGDSRFKPLRWEWGSGAKGTWSKAPYSTDFSVKEAGKYTLSVIFGLEIYTENGWESGNLENSLTLSFNVVAKEFTMKATATKGGTISPLGTMTITQGKDYTFTMTPDKNHKLYKVYIDGKETTVKDLKYTFEDVNGDHTIHVVFQKSGNLDAPKTGDHTNPWILWTLVGISAAVIIAVGAIIIYRGIKRKGEK